MSKLNESLTIAASERDDNQFMNLITKFLTLRFRITMTHSGMLKAVVESHFKTIFPGSDAKYYAKTGGVQLGIRTRVILSSGEERTYYVKTHSEGRQISNSAPAKRVNPQELLAYKILECTGFGCESHFCQRSAEDVYIATLDAGYGGSFETFIKATGQARSGHGADEGYGQTIWGLLQSIEEHPSKNDYNAIRTMIKEDPNAQNFLIQISSLDILTRILHLHDLLSNTENYGFFKTDQQLPALKILDFRTVDNFHINFGLIESFFEGTGWLRYVESHRTVRYVLRDRPRSERIETAIDVLSHGPLKQLHDHTDHA